LNGFVDDGVFRDNLFCGSRLEVGHSGIWIAEIYLSEALIEYDFGRIEFKLESQLFVVTRKRDEVSYNRFCASTADGKMPGKGEKKEE
jgi:hypothetical protein